VTAAWPRRRWLIAGIAVAALLAAVGSYSLAGSARTSPALTRITVRPTPIPSFDNRDPSRVRFDEMEFRGGLALTSDYEPFGGISALHMEPDGSHFLALSDKGSWLRARIVY